MTEKPIFYVQSTFTALEKYAMAVEQWKQDGVRKLPQGVSLVPRGRDASLYLRKGNRFMALYAELAGVSDIDVCVYTERGTSQWIDLDSFEALPASLDEQHEALQLVRTWLTARGTKFAFFPPETEHSHSKEGPDQS